MLTLELSSYALEIPNDAYTTISQNLIAWLSNTQSTRIQVDWLILENNEKAVFSVNTPYCHQFTWLTYP